MKTFEQCFDAAREMVAAYRAQAPVGFDPQNIYPALLAGLALTAAGTGATIAANEESQSAMNSAREAEQARQREFQKEGQKRFDVSLQQAAAPRANATINKDADARTAAYAQMAQAPQGATAPNVAPQGDQVISSPETGAEQRAQTAGNAWTNLTSKAQARLGAVGDWGLQRSIENKEAGQDLGIIANKSQGSLNVLPLEMDKASHAGDGLRTLGTVASALGSIGMLAGATAPVAATEAAPALSADEAAELAPEQIGSGAGFFSGQINRANPWARIPLAQE